MTTLRDIQKSLTFQRRIPEQHVVIIERDGLAHRLAGPGYVSIDRLNESYGPMIRFGWQEPVEVAVEDARSVDGDIFGLEFNILYGFDPKRCNLQKNPQMVRKSPIAQANIINQFGRQLIHTVIGELSSAQLRLGNIRTEIEYQLQARLRREEIIRIAGVEIYNVIVERLTLPEEWDTVLRGVKAKETQLEFAAHEREKLAHIEALETEIRAKAEAQATQLLGEAGIVEKRLILELLASLDDSELAKHVTNAEVLRTLASNGGSVNLVTPLDGYPGSTFPSLLAQYAMMNGQARTNGNGNGKH